MRGVHTEFWHPKIAISHWLAVSPLQQCSTAVRHCDCKLLTDLAAVISQHGLSPHQYADNTQIYGSCSPTDVHAFSMKVSECLNDVASWIRCNRLQLNPGKTELLWWSTDRRRHWLPTSALTIDSTSVLPVFTIRDLEIFVDWPGDVHTCVPHCLVLLRHAASVAQHPLPCLCVNLPVAGHCSGPLPSGLR